MLSNFSLFYKNFGIRTVGDLFNPPIQTHIEVPQLTILHYTCDVDEDDKDLDIDMSAPFISGFTKRIPVRYFTEYKEPTVGSFTKKPLNVNEHTRPWFRDNKIAIRAKTDDPVSVDRTVLNIFNYSYLHRAYQYPDSSLSDYHKFQNHYGTIFSTMAAFVGQSQHEHFIEIKIEQDLPSVSMLNMYQDNPTVTFVNIFDKSYKLLIMEIWKWLNPELRHSSIFHVFKVVDYTKIIFIFSNENNECTYLNMGFLNSWTYGEDQIKGAKVGAQLKYQVLQKAFLNFLIKLNSSVDSFDEQEPVADTDPKLETADTDEQGTTPIPYDDDEESDQHTDSSVNSVYAKNAKIKNVSIKSVQTLSEEGDLGSSTLEDHLKDMEENIDIQEKKTKKVLTDSGEKISASGELVEELVVPLSPEAIVAEYLLPKSPLDYTKAAVEKMSDDKNISAADYKAMLKRIQASAELPNPYDSKIKLYETSIDISEAKVDEVKSTLDLPPVVGMIDASMGKSSLNNYTSGYLKNLLKKEIVGMSASFAKAGVLTKSYAVYKEESALGSYEFHDIVLQPIGGPISSIPVRLPVVDEDGSFVVSGNKYSMRPQRTDMPIRKISPILVGLTSYYGKTFVGLSEKKAQSHLGWLVSKIYQLNIDSQDVVKEVTASDAFFNYNKAPAMYNGLANNFRSIRVNDVSFEFAYNHRKETLSEDDEVFKGWYDRDKKYACGINDKNQIVAMDDDGNLYTRVKDIWISSPSLYDMLGIRESDGPMEASNLNVFSKPVSVAVVLAYRMGLHNLLILLKDKYGLQYRFSEGKRLAGLADNEYSIKFKDGFLVLTKGDRTAQFIMAGFTFYEKETKQYNIREFYFKHVYLNLLKAKGLTTIYLNEIDNLCDMFVDPITARLLQNLGEPQTFEGLLLRATELLKTYEYPDSQDMEYQRIRGYERFAGAIYKQVSSSIRSYRNKINRSRSKIDMSPFQVSQYLMQDPSIKIVEDINPIQNVKHAEIVTYVGEGGRDKSTLNKASRAYNPNDIGIISEATVDSSDVGVNTYMPPNPNFATVYGNKGKNMNIGPASVLSTSALLAPGSTNDDPKRVAFVSIQQSHTVAAAGYHAPVVRTGYEYVIGQRTSDMFCVGAKEDGVIKAVNDKGIIIEYKDGTTKGIKLGTQYGKAEGAIYPHDIVPNGELKVGKSFKKGDVLAYNTGFFEKDILDPSQVIFKNSFNTLVCYMEVAETHEDSCAISPAMAEKLVMKSTYTRSILLDFEEGVMDVIKIGTKVMPNSPLMTIVDDITNTGGFDEKAFATLRRHSSQSPKSKYKGTISKIEVFYHGDKEDMSPSIKTLADASDKDRLAVARATGANTVTGRVNDDYRVDGTSLTLNRAEIKIYITSEISAGTADKVVLCNQLKSVIGEVISSPMRTEQGQAIDMKFSYRSIAKRITHSPIIIGILTTVSIVHGKVIASMTS